ncbi:MAG: hypothetical protein L0Z50_28205 [Verrucomicrobiales bacterium]|nr:hypothetical protein [Verrucomicrobiales bacterium]
MFRRILKNGAALGLGHVLQLLTQLLLPPVFLASYGVDGFAGWLVMTAMVSHLTTLDFGLQSYTLNALTILFHRGDRARFHRLQSVGLWLMLGLVGFGTAVLSIVFVLPVHDWLRLHDTMQPRWTLFLLGAQLLASIALGQLNGLHRVFGKAHRAVLIQNGQKLAMLIMTLTLAVANAPFWLIAATQLACVGLSLLLALRSLAKTAPEIFPTLRFWDLAEACDVLRQSSLFGLFTLNQLLVFQAPVLIVNHLLGPAAVVAFSVTRTLFSFVRQGTNLLQVATAPEMTRLAGVRDTAKLGRLYQLSESAVLSVALIGNTAMLLGAPLVLGLWLKRPDLFEPRVALLMMLISLALSVKEYKLYFQYATNEHARTAILTSISYALMVAAAVPLTLFFGVAGLLWIWLAAEVIQIACIHSCNVRLLQGATSPKIIPYLKLAAAAMAMAAIFTFAARPPLFGGDLVAALKATALLLLLTAGCYFLFDGQMLAAAWRQQLNKE